MPEYTALTYFYVVINKTKQRQFLLRSEYLNRIQARGIPGGVKSEEQASVDTAQVPQRIERQFFVLPRNIDLARRFL